ncbi:hypothetical protein MBLNU457_3896t1 [Dothideomycetes sp. NU457]
MLNAKSNPVFARRYANGQTKAAQPVEQSRPSISTQRPSPQCTHVTMDRMRSRLRCDICDQPSWMGWLYVCSQDETIKAPINTKNLQQPLDDLAELHYLRFSPSVISQYQAGGYTTAQMDIMKEQKRKVQSTIADTIKATLDECRPSTITRDGSKKRADLSAQHSMGVPHKRDFSPSGALAQTSKVSAIVNSIDQNSYLTNLSRAAPPCDFRCCHRCRPFLQERLPYSLNAVLEDDISPPSADDMKNTHVIDAKVASQFGLKHPPRITFRTIDSRDAMDFDFRPLNSPFPSMSSIASTLEHSSSKSSLYLDESGGTDAEEDAAALRLHELVTGKTSQHVKPAFHQPRIFNRATASNELSPSDTSSITSSGQSPTTPSRASSVGVEIASHAGDTSATDIEDEIEAEGGVALTEEAVEKHMPDIMT